MRAIRNRITTFVGTYEKYLIPLGRFLVAFAAFFIIRSNLGYSTIAGKIPVLLVLALVCGILPLYYTILASAALITLHLYSLSMACALVFLMVFLVICLIYFRFSSKDRLIFLLTPITFHLHIPYVMPIATGLLKGPASIVSMMCGTVIYYLLSGIVGHASEIKEMETLSEIGLTSKINVALGQIIGNKEMYLVMIVFIVTAIVVYFIRRANVDHAWTLAIAAGILIQLLGLFTGYMALRVAGKILWLMVGGLISLIISFVLQFLYMDLDYSRVERVQFEDDEYYYYVKAVPKNLASARKTKKTRFSSEKNAEQE